MKTLVIVSFVALSAAAAGFATTSSQTADQLDAPSASAAAGSLVGTWSRVTTCTELATALTKAGLQKVVVEFIVGNGFIPGVTSPEQIADPANPCEGAVPRKHAHFFRKNGEFGSLDWKGQVVDDGRFRIVKPGTVVIFKEFPKVTFRYRIRGKKISFTPLIPSGCTAFRCMWAISMAYPGKTWHRVR
jgi:hypothetical protein